MRKLPLPLVLIFNFHKIIHKVTLIFSGHEHLSEAHRKLSVVCCCCLTSIHSSSFFPLFLCSALVDEFSPMVDDARMRLLGQYEQNLRPSMGASLNNAIETIKAFLDRYMPAE